MIRKIPASERHFADHGWLKTHYLFSFSTYYDPANIRFGPLRVFNDDVIERNGGFGTHPHEEMEIITIMLKGELTHEDSMGNIKVLGDMDVQTMSAGTGITHSEHNRSDKLTHLCQIWIFPDKKKVTPAYDQKSFNKEDRKNVLLPVASGQSYYGALPINANSTIYLSDLENGKSIGINTDGSRRTFIYVTDGEIRVNSKNFYAGDQARIKEEEAVVIEALEDTSFILIDLPARRLAVGPFTAEP